MPLNLPPPKVSNASSGLPATNGSVASARPVNLNGSNGQASYQQQDASSHDTAEPSTSSSVGPSSSSSSFTSKLGLPPPKTKSKQAASNQPKKFVLDLPKATRSASELEDGNDSSNGTEEPAAKKSRTVGGGLSALLPQPKIAAVGPGGLSLPAPKVASRAPESSKPATSMIPHTLKGKNKASEKPMAQPEASHSTPVQAEDEQPDNQEEEADSAVLDFFGLGPAAAEEEEEEEAADDAPVDFFGLSTAKPAIASKGTTFTNAPTSVMKTTSINVAPSSSTFASASIKKVSAAPTTAAPDLASNYYATLPVPTKSDPYPGFYQKADGSWAPKRPEEWETWSAAQGWNDDAAAEAEAEQQRKEKEFKMPADFSSAAAEQSLEVRAANLRGKGADDPAKPGRFTDEEQKKIEEDQNKAKAKKFSHNARSRHQLTTLVADAQMNRAQLEDRISQMKANKRTGGQKYGF